MAMIMMGMVCMIMFVVMFFSAAATIMGAMHVCNERYAKAEENEREIFFYH